MSATEPIYQPRTGDTVVVLDLRAFGQHATVTRATRTGRTEIRLHLGPRITTDRDHVRPD